MVGKFPKRIKYQKKNFNIYKRFNDKFVKKSQIPIEKVPKNKINNNDPILKRTGPIKSSGLFGSMFDDLFDLMKKK